MRAQISMTRARNAYRRVGRLRGRKPPSVQPRWAANTPQYAYPALVVDRFPQFFLTGCIQASILSRNAVTNKIGIAGTHGVLFFYPHFFTPLREGFFLP